MMVDGKTIEKLSLDFDSLAEEVKRLKERVSVLEKNEGLIEALKSKEFQDYLQSIKKSDPDKK